MTTEKLVSNWKKPDNKFWKTIGNICAIVGGPVGTLAIMIFVPTEYKDASIAAWVALMSAIKAGSKLTTEKKQ